MRLGARTRDVRSEDSVPCRNGRGGLERIDQAGQGAARGVRRLSKVVQGGTGPFNCSAAMGRSDGKQVATPGGDLQFAISAAVAGLDSTCREAHLPFLRERITCGCFRNIGQVDDPQEFVVPLDCISTSQSGMVGIRRQTSDGMSDASDSSP